MGFFAGALLCGVLLADSAWTQPPVKWWKDSATIARLRLTPRQSADLESLYQTEFEQRMKNAEEVRRLTESLNALLESPTATEPQVIAASEELAAAQTRRNILRTLVLVRMREVLTPHQRRALKVLHDEQRGGQSKKKD